MSVSAVAETEGAPNRWPPVGRRKSSLAGIICSSLAILEGLAIVVGMVVSK